MIEFKHVNKKYSDGTEALKDFSLKIHKGEIVTLIGPSGCGKTTTMKTINRLIEPSSGAIYIDGQNIKEYSIDELRWNIGYVLQQIALFPHMTIEENISIVPEMKKWSKEDIRKRNDELLNMVGLDPSIYKKRMPSELSGGEQQRVGVIRALAADPDIILMDEPFSALDPISREQLQKDVKILQKEIKKTIVFVTHDIDEAFKMGDRVCIMREGELVQIDQPAQLMMNPKNAFVHDFLGKRNSPWLITAGEIAQNTDSDRFIQSMTYETGTYKHGTFILVDIDNRFTNVLHNDKLIDGISIEDDMSLYEVTERIQGSDQGIFPVLKNDHVIGVLSYKDIVAYLKKEADMKNEVLLSE